MKTLIDDTPALQYKLELWLAGMLDVVSRNGDVNSALAELRKREAAWNRYQPIREYETLVSNCNVLSKAVTADFWSRSSESGYVDFQQITPEPQWGLPERWKLQLDFPILSIAIYPEQDLLLAVEARYVAIHLQYHIIDIWA